MSKVCMEHDLSLQLPEEWHCDSSRLVQKTLPISCLLPSPHRVHLLGLFRSSTPHEEASSLDGSLLELSGEEGSRNYVWSQAYALPRTGTWRLDDHKSKVITGSSESLMAVSITNIFLSLLITMLRMKDVIGFRCGLCLPRCVLTWFPMRQCWEMGPWKAMIMRGWSLSHKDELAIGGV